MATAAILERLLVENLVSATSEDLLNDKDKDSWVVVDGRSELDRDPRWKSLFMEFFLENEHSDSNDDLLFFVRESSLLDQDDQEPLFVRRKTSRDMPPLDSPPAWKETFFLNLIVQLPCTLTVSVCRRISTPETPTKRSILNSGTSERILVVPGSPSSSTESLATEQLSSADPASSTSRGTTPTPPDTPVTATPPPTSALPRKGRSRMVAQRRVTKKVYAAPYKSRMDVKDAFMNEMSFPLVYYTVNDYESFDLHVPIHEHEYLCAELCVLIPLSSDTASELPSPVDVAADNTPFPCPIGFRKVVVFQGAVPYAALQDIYLQKGMAVGNLKMGWNKLAARGPGGGLGGSEGAFGGLGA
ncbi:hypothetical protein HK096_007564, partial [Nowakowskiella sp. JEL0078]